MLSHLGHFTSTSWSEYSSRLINTVQKCKLTQYKFEVNVFSFWDKAMFVQTTSNFTWKEKNCKAVYDCCAVSKHGQFPVRWFICLYVSVQNLKSFKLLLEKKKVELRAGILQDSSLSWVLTLSPLMLTSVCTAYLGFSLLGHVHIPWAGLGTPRG